MKYFSKQIKVNRINNNNFNKIGDFFQYEIDLVKEQGEDLTRYILFKYLPGNLQRPLEDEKKIVSNIDGYELLLLEKETKEKLDKQYYGV